MRKPKFQKRACCPTPLPLSAEAAAAAAAGGRGGGWGHQEGMRSGVVRGAGP